MTDHTQLRKLAEASLVNGEELAAMSVSEFSRNAELRLAFPSAANPQAVIELLDEIERLRKDAERLNWIQRNLFGHKWNGVIDSGSRTHWSIWTGFRNVTVDMVGDTFRSAIDAAMVK